MKLLIRWVISALALFAAAWLVPGIRVEGTAWVVFAVTSVAMTWLVSRRSTAVYRSDSAVTIASLLSKY